MSGARLGVVACRLPVMAFWVVTALYGLLAYVPFTYHQVVEFHAVPGLDVFATYHQWFALGALALAVCSLLDDLRSGPQGLAVGFVFVNAVLAAGLLFVPVLASLGNNSTALAIAAVSLVPLVWLAIIDWAVSSRALTWRRPDDDEDGRVVLAALAAGLLATVLSAGIVAARVGAFSPVAGMAAGVAWAWSLVSHLLLFSGLAAVLLVIRGVSAFFARPSVAEFVFVMLAGMLGLAYVVTQVVLRAISLTGPQAVSIALVFSAALAASCSGLALRLWPPATPVTNGLDLAVRPFGGSTPPRWFPVAFAVLAGFGYVLVNSAASMDWNYLLQQLVALLLSVLVFALAYGAVRVSLSRTSAAVLLALVAFLSLGAFHAANRFSGTVALAIAGDPVDVTRVLDRYAGYDASFRFLHERLRVEAARPEETVNLFPLLQRHTNIPRTVPIDLPDVALTPSLAPGQALRPHIFILVIDSLRPDYLAPYNPAVTFTPAIAAFAGESHVFSNAFSRYGATGLSEPAIWVGGQIPHQQYPASFSRINALRKLVAAEQYTGFVSMDTILRATVDPWPELRELDAGRPNKDYRLCGSLEELGEQLRRRPAGATDPVFVYTQPQDIHISAITREGKSVLDDGAYSGFYPPYASRLKRIDGCVGAFISTLKQTGIYENSVVVLTSDHGDSLGEEGRWGHAYTVFPEVVRVPLIVHLPASARTLAVDTKAVTFTTDITPSLYYLLGHRDLVNQPLLGGPLFTATAGERTPYLRDSWVVASSYGPVYGWVNDRGRSLYILDASSYRDYAYNLMTGVAGTSMAVSADVRRRGGEHIQAALQEIAKFYRIPIDH